MYTKRIPESSSHTDRAGRLGRHVRHDERSRYFPFPSEQIPDIRTIRHRRVIAVLDQLYLGSCTGNAMEGALGSELFMNTIPEEHERKPTGDALLDEDQAILLYSEATVLDQFLGVYPPTDTGSSGLGVAKAAKNAGLISGYTHCFSLESALKAISIQPVISGFTWYSTFDDPGPMGLVTISPNAEPRGGHEVVLDEIDVENHLIGATNSWGPNWGLNGRFFLSWDDFGRLLHEEGDVTVPTPLDQPSPEPVAPLDAQGCLPKFIRSLVSKP